jgi:hypothetical protein
MKYRIASKIRAQKKVVSSQESGAPHRTGGCVEASECGLGMSRGGWSAIRFLTDSQHVSPRVCGITSGSDGVSPLWCVSSYPNACYFETPQLRRSRGRDALLTPGSFKDIKCHYLLNLCVLRGLCVMPLFPGPEPVSWTALSKPHPRQIQPIVPSSASSGRTISRQESGKYPGSCA